jgi:hypothetical protein
MYLMVSQVSSSKTNRARYSSLVKMRQRVVKMRQSIGVFVF